MERRAACRRFVALALMLLAPLSKAVSAPCDLSPVSAKQTVPTNVPLMGQNIDVLVHLAWRFEEQPDGLVKITEIAGSELRDFKQKVLPAVASRANIPRDDCDVYASIDGQNATVRQPSLVLHFDISATKWTCPGMHVPCPTIPQPLRMCYKRLTKTIVGQGSGWYEVAFLPTLFGNDIVLDKNETSHFSVNSIFGLGGVFANIFGPIAQNLAHIGKISIPYPVLRIPAEELQANENSSPLQWNWINQSVSFREVTEQSPSGVQYIAIELVRERVTTQRPAISCVFRDEVQK